MDVSSNYERWNVNNLSTSKLNINLYYLYCLIDRPESKSYQLPSNKK